MENSKKLLIVGAIVVVVLCAFAYKPVQWLLFEMEAREAFNDKTGLGRFPTLEDIVGVKGVLQKKAAARGFTNLTVFMAIERRSFGPAKFWYVKAVMSSGSHKFENERRIETGIGQEELEFFDENGFAIIIPKER